jgi:hypothetical protein
MSKTLCRKGRVDDSHDESIADLLRRQRGATGAVHPVHYTECSAPSAVHRVHYTEYDAPHGSTKRGIGRACWTLASRQKHSIPWAIRVQRLRG